MGYVAVGFLGVLLGAGVTAGVVLLLLQRAVDRDLVERRLRALLSYREALGTPAGLAQGAAPRSLDPEELDQLIHNLEAVAGEFRLTAWTFDEPLRSELSRSLLAFEEEARRARGRGERPSAVRIVDAYRQLELTLRQAALGGVREFRRWRFWPEGRRRAAEEGEARARPPGPRPPAGLDVSDINISLR